MKITRIAAVGLISASLAVGGLAGCGSSSSDSAAADTAAEQVTVDTSATDTMAADGDFTATANQICTDNTVAIQQAIAGSDVSDIASLQNGLKTAAETSRANFDKLKALEPPADAMEAYDAFLTAQEAVVVGAEDLAAKVGAETDVESAKAMVVAAGAEEQPKAAEVVATAKAAGLDGCAGTEAPGADGSDVESTD